MAETKPSRRLLDAPLDGPDAGPRARAAALPPAERRAEIIAATMPLLLAYGPSVTTRQIAEAAGIAEGTIFRVFPDKDSLIEAVVDSALDPSAAEDELRNIDPALDLDARLTAIVDILRRRVANVFHLMTAVGMTSAPKTHRERERTDLSVVAKLLEPDSAALRRDPVEVAHLLRGLTIAGTHPALMPDAPLSSADVVSLLLDGLRARPDDPPPNIPLAKHP
jgi:AcrR family transcriptional regulator